MKCIDFNWLTNMLKTSIEKKDLNSLPLLEKPNHWTWTSLAILLFIDKHSLPYVFYTMYPLVLFFLKTSVIQ